MTKLPGAATQDVVSITKRSEMMRSVRQTGTRPELAVRRLLRTLGLKYRVRNRDLPGSPDIANRRRKWAIFVNGCFWHGHKNCPKTKSGTGPRVPVGNQLFWREKLKANRLRDARTCIALREMGYRVLIVWECKIWTPDVLVKRLRLLSYDR
jgi:DNA mismatch endonuclease (patch repair protein)